MGKFKIHEMVFDQGDKEKLKFKIQVNIDSRGIFSTMLPSEVVTVLERAGDRADINRLGNKGMVSNNTFDGLVKDIADRVSKALKPKIVDKRVVLTYGYKGLASWWEKSDGTILANGQGARGDGGWKNGTVELNATNKAPYGFLIAVEVREKTTLEFPSGAIRSEYKNGYDEDTIGDDNLKWLNHLTVMSFGSHWGHGKLDGDKELEYTPERALFFRNMVEGCIKLVRMMSVLDKEDGVDLLIEQDIKMLK